MAGSSCECFDVLLVAIAIRYSGRFSPCHIVNPSCEPCEPGGALATAIWNESRRCCEKYIGDRMYIRTLAYLVLRSVRVVNKLLGTHVLSVVMRNREMLLRDDAVAGAGFVFEAFAIE